MNNMSLNALEEAEKIILGGLKGYKRMEWYGKTKG